MTQYSIPILKSTYKSCSCGQPIKFFKNSRGDEVEICPVHGETEISKKRRQVIGVSCRKQKKGVS